MRVLQTIDSTLPLPHEEISYYIGRISWAILGFNRQVSPKRSESQTIWEGGVGAVNGGIDRRRGSRIFFRPQRFEEYG